jgi:hypothetical protein
VSETYLILRTGSWMCVPFFLTGGRDRVLLDPSKQNTWSMAMRCGCVDATPMKYTFFNCMYHQAHGGVERPSLELCVHGPCHMVSCCPSGAHVQPCSCWQLHCALLLHCKVFSHQQRSGVVRVGD